MFPVESEAGEIQNNPYPINMPLQPQQMGVKVALQRNPLKLLDANPYSGTLHIENLRNINKLYEMMVEAIHLNESNANAGGNNIIGENNENNNNYYLQQGKNNNSNEFCQDNKGMTYIYLKSIINFSSYIYQICISSLF